jgi:hypothetical protein
MAFITWIDKLSVKVESPDNQHTVMTNTLNDLHTDRYLAAPASHPPFIDADGAFRLNAALQGNQPQESRYNKLSARMIEKAN